MPTVADPKIYQPTATPAAARLKAHSSFGKAAMRILIAGVSIAILGMTATSLPSTAPDTADDPPIRVVAGRDAPNVSRSSPTPNATTLTAEASPDKGPDTLLAVEPDRNAMNMAQSDEPFISQSRNPEWANRIESMITTKLPRDAAITCAEFMCKVTIRLMPDSLRRNVSNSDIEFPDKLGAMFTQSWPQDISYNRDTASISRQSNGDVLTFFVTRAQWPDSEETMIN